LNRAFSSETVFRPDPDREPQGSVFLAKSGAARYQVRAFSAASADRAAWSAAIAQLVEHVIRNDGVTGSNPVCGTSTWRIASQSPNESRGPFVGQSKSD
jgi:hypothetical protein